jgi:ketosteroid isomerase-like protein
MRSAAYYGASATERRRAHEALAAASDPIRDADLRTWHRAAAATEPDEEIARDLERSAQRARSRGGWTSAAAFFERAAELTQDASVRAERTLATAHARLLAGQPGAARTALKQALRGLADPISRCRATRLEGTIDFMLGRPADASATLLTAANMCAVHDVREARDTLLEAFDAAHLAGGFADIGLAEVLAVARSHGLSGARGRGARPTVGDALLDGFAAVHQSGDAVGIPLIRRALELALDHPIADEDLGWIAIAWMAAPELYDDRTWQALTSRWAMAARMRGTVIALPIGLGRMPHVDVVRGRFAAAERGFAEARELAAATENAARLAAYTTAEVAALAWRGREAETRTAAAGLIPELTSRGRGVGIRMVHLSTSVLELALGNYREAFRAARKAWADDPLLHLNGAPELIEAATRCGELVVAQAALDRLSARAQASGTDWGTGLMLRSQALLAERAHGEVAYDWYEYQSRSARF